MNWLHGTLFQNGRNHGGCWFLPSILVIGWRLPWMTLIFGSTTLVIILVAANKSGAWRKLTQKQLRGSCPFWPFYGAKLSAMGLGSGNHRKYSQLINVFSCPDAESCRSVAWLCSRGGEALTKWCILPRNLPLWTAALTHWLSIVLLENWLRSNRRQINMINFMQFMMTQIALSDSLSVKRRLWEEKGPWRTPMHLAQRRKYRRSFTILEENKFQPGSHELSATSRMWSLFNFQPH